MIVPSPLISKFEVFIMANNTEVKDLIVYIPIDKIIPPSFDQRFTINEEEDLDLEESIKELGILLPLIVKRKNSKYEIVAGNRRFKAAGNIFLKSVPCLITTKSDSDIEQIKLHENIKRLPLSHIDQAVTFVHIIEEYNMTETEVSALVGKSVAYVCQHLSLLKSDSELIQSVQTGSLSFTVARELMYCKNKDDLKLFIKYAQDDGASCVVVKSWVSDSNKKPLESTNFSTADIDSVTEPPSSEPGFICPSCREFKTYRFLKVLKICSSCEFIINEAIKLAKEENSP